MPTLQAGPYQVEYREVGQSPVVILVHSSASGMGQWRKLMDALAPKHRAIAYNLFGCGETTPWPNTRPQTLTDQAKLVTALADHAGGNVHVVGHSFGGSVAMKAALALGSRLASLTLLEPNPFFLLQQHGHMEAYQEACGLRDHVKRFGGLGQWEAVAERFADYWNAPGAWAAMPPDRRQVFLKMLPSNFHEWDAVMAETTRVTEWLPLASRMAVVTAKDTVRPIREIAELLSTQLPGLRWETIPQGGHMAPLTRPDVVNPLVLAHIGKFMERD